MPLLAKVFWVAKAGNSPDEYEDAFDINVEAGRFAIADGATESFCAREWAQLLVRGFVNNSSGKMCIEEWLAPLQESWHKAIDWSALPWYAEEKARSGAFAAFLGLELDVAVSHNASPRWRAIAVGDCALFHVRDNELKTAFPLANAREFGSRPILLCSNPIRNQAVWREVRIQEGDWYPGDLFFLSTDALAQWFLTQWEAGAEPWSMLHALDDSQEKFEEFVTELRSKNLVRNDDMTLIIIRTG